MTKRLPAVIDREQAQRFEEAWGRYVRRELARDPKLADVKQEVLAVRVAERLGRPFTAQTFSKIKSGRQEPYAQQLLAIAAEMGEDPDWLAGLKTTSDRKTGVMGDERGA